MIRNMWQTGLIVAVLVISTVDSNVVLAGDDGFRPLFSNKNKNGWMTKGNWKISEDGMISLKPRKGERGWQRYDAYIWSGKKYANFVLDLEFKIPKKGNSGVFIRVGDRANPVETGLEVQIYDSYGNKKKLTHHDNGGVIRTIGASKNASKPAGKWNRMIVMCQGNHMTVQLNGEEIVDIQLDEYKTSKTRPMSGYVGLQDHGLPMWFRNVKIKELK